MIFFVAKRFLSLAACAAIIVPGAALGGQPACKPLWDATFTRARLAYRSTIDTTQPGKKPLHAEEIYTSDSWYRKFDNRWIKTPTSPSQQVAGIKTINATFFDCRHEGDVLLNGEPVSIYSAKTRNLTLLPFTGDLKMWISRKRGVPVRTEANASLPILGFSHTVKTYVYDNVRPPM